MEKLLIYDCEIINLIPDKYKPNNPNYTYCGGWKDFDFMGISVIGTWRNYDLITVLGKDIILPLPWGKYQAFINYWNLTEVGLGYIPDFERFNNLVEQCDRLVGFNSYEFDDRLCHANELYVNTNFDLLQEVRIASGQPRFYQEGITKGGYNLNNLALKNLGVGKTGSGELAPKLWQDGRHEEVINYCLNDVSLLRSLYFRFVNGLLRDPHSGVLLS